MVTYGHDRLGSAVRTRNVVTYSGIFAEYGGLEIFEPFCRRFDVLWIGGRQQFDGIDGKIGSCSGYCDGLQAEGRLRAGVARQQSVIRRWIPATRSFR